MNSSTKFTNKKKKKTNKRRYFKYYIHIFELDPTMDESILGIENNNNTIIKVYIPDALNSVI